MKSGATLELDGDGLIVNKALRLEGPAASSTGGILANTGGDNTWSGAITVAVTGIITSEAGNTLTVSNTIVISSTNADATLITRGAGNIILSNIISGAGSISKSGNGVLELRGSNTYRGETSVSGGTLRVTDQNALGITTAPRGDKQPITTLSGGATLELAAGASGAFTIGETLNLGAGGGTLRNASGSNIWSGPIRFSTHERYTVPHHRKQPDRLDRRGNPDLAGHPESRVEQPGDCEPRPHRHRFGPHPGFPAGLTPAGAP